MAVQPEGQQADRLSTFLYPGTLFAQRGPYVITTILGSCVAVCLWDPVLRVGGMNHYLLPLWNGDGLPTPKYGNVAIPMLIEKLVSLGSQKQNIKAKVFGGANVLENLSGLLDIGERNIRIFESILSECRIEVLGKDVGGTVGRKVIFDTFSGSVFVKKNIK